MARHWAFRYRIDRQHLTGPFVVIVTRACHWTVRYLLHKGHSIGPFITVLSKGSPLDHWPSKLDYSLPFSQRAHHWTIGQANWTIHCRSLKGSTAGPLTKQIGLFIAVLSQGSPLDHWPSQFSIVLKLVRFPHRHYLRIIKSKTIWRRKIFTVPRDEGDSSNMYTTCVVNQQMHTDKIWFMIHWYSSTYFGRFCDLYRGAFKEHSQSITSSSSTTS
jgi:hypothetical protein